MIIKIIVESVKSEENRIISVVNVYIGEVQFYYNACISGRRSVLKVLLEIRGILMDQDCRYVLNDLYITDYCVWIQSTR